MGNLHALINFKKQLVREALEGGNGAFVARKHGVSASALCRWIQQYRDEVEEAMGKRKSVNELNNPETAEEWKKKYEQATKLLGEKEMEIALLRELVKKTCRRNNGAGPRMDRQRLQNADGPPDLQHSPIDVLLQEEANRKQRRWETQRSSCTGSLCNV